MLEWWRLLADITIDPLAGNSGWAGAGLLGLVLCWLLLKHLPDKDRQLKELLEARDKQLQAIIDGKDRQLKELTDAKDVQMKELIERKAAAVRELTLDYKESLSKVVVHCETETLRMATQWQEHNKSLVAAITDLSVKVDGIYLPSRKNT